MESSSRPLRILAICLGIIVILALIVNFAVNYLANKLAHSIVNEHETNLNFLMDVRALPYPKITISNLVYTYQGKTALSVGKAYLDFSLFDLFKKQLHIYHIYVDKVSLNLPNFPQTKKKQPSSPEEKSQNENETTSTPQEEKPANQATKALNNFTVDVIDLNHLNIIYASSPKDSSIYIDTIKVNLLSSENNQFQIAVNTNYHEQPLQAKILLQFEKGNLNFDGNLTLANNQVAMTAEYKQGQLRSQIKGTLNNPKALELIIAIAAQKLPTQFDATLQGDSQQITIAPIQIQYPAAAIQADLNFTTKAPLKGNLTIPETLLEQLAAGEPSPNCPLPHMATEIIKGIRMDLQMTIVPTNADLNAARKTLIQIVPSGISLENGILPANLQQNFLSCFNYQLQNTSGTVHIEG
ncbi:putative protein involved in outer membrane biogenesis [Legionella massiliensis]|uniref:AsmA domain-containing protein n=2 Tax=Legionella massiliensis TaxID=1034943 RepID=A0A078KW22_9GAMM|nr:putative protein involved in outer membrane biogenesis [Legionella massiliensis]CEE11636.1 hypothetical protein BN1094_00158 [Legionella massiliensis]